jgi:hypothetical protein
MRFARVLTLDFTPDQSREREFVTKIGSQPVVEERGPPHFLPERE